MTVSAAEQPSRRRECFEPMLQGGAGPAACLCYVDLFLLLLPLELLLLLLLSESPLA